MPGKRKLSMSKSPYAPPYRGPIDSTTSEIAIVAKPSSKRLPALKEAQKALAAALEVSLFLRVL